jgi:DNA processing protein
MQDSLQHQIALTLVPQVGAITAKLLVSYCGSAEAVFKASRKELLKIPGIGALTVDYIQDGASLALAEHELAFVEKNEIQALFYTHPKYPARLKLCNDCPALLYFKGSDVDLLSANRIVAMVGTRQPTEHGRAVCEDIVEGLRAYNVLIVSGLAFGVDITSHRKANSVDIPNIGVLGHGLASVYPSQHKSVAQRMIENGGLLSEFISDAKPDRENFPMRNRIIAGLCDALIVVETAASGGSMISADLASRYEREVFAVPGRVNDPKSIGCNQLLKSNKAKMIENAHDLALAMQWAESGKPRAIQTQLFLDLTDAEQNIVQLIRQKPEIAIDELVFASKLPSGVLAALILGLEFKSVIRTLPGKRYLVIG